MAQAVGQFILSSFIYALWVYDLYHAHGSDFTVWQALYPINGVLGALGVWVLSSRWTGSLGGRWVAGAVYGLGPYGLAMLRFHPVAGTVVALVPWLFCPVFHLERVGRKLGLRASHTATRAMLKLLLATLPWAVIIGFFQWMTHLRRFVLPLQLSQSVWADWPGVIAPWPLVLQGRHLLGVYHVPLALALMGWMVMFRARRWGPMACMLLALLLTLTRGVWEVSPLAWMSVLWVFAAVLCGVGTDALVKAGRSDLRWITWAPVLQGGLAVVLLLSAGKYFQVFWGGQAARILLYCARFYLIGAVCLGLLAVMTYRGLRWRFLRWLLILGPVGIDLFFSSRFLVDRLL